MFYGDIYQVKHNVLAARSYCTRQCVSSLRTKSDFKLCNVHVLHDMYNKEVFHYVTQFMWQTKFTPYLLLVSLT